MGSISVLTKARQVIGETQVSVALAVLPMPLYLDRSLAGRISNRSSGSTTVRATMVSGPAMYKTWATFSDGPGSRAIGSIESIETTEGLTDNRAVCEQTDSSPSSSDSGERTGLSLGCVVNGRGKENEKNKARGLDETLIV
jgi:hypothetical protein